MRVNNINSNLNFGRVIPVKYTSIKREKGSKGMDEALLELQDILNSTEPFYYSKEESEKIREFFKAKIEDYNGKKGVLIVNTDKGTALLTGKDASHVRNVKASGKSNNTIANIVKERIEDGRPGMADAKITLVSDARKKAAKSGKTLSKRDASRFDFIKYQFTYSSKHPEKFESSSSRKTFTSLRTEIYDESELKI